MIRFTAQLSAGTGTATGVSVPEHIWHELTPARKAAVVVTINGDHSYRSSIGWYRGAFMLPVSAEHRAAAGIAAGDTVELEIELDTEPRTVEVPEDLQAELDANPAAAAAWEKLSFTGKKEHARSLTEAKAPETRTRRLAKTMAALTER